MNSTMRVTASPLPQPRSRNVARITSVAVVGLVCFVLGFVALHQQTSTSSFGHLEQVVKPAVQARHQLQETRVVKLQELELNNDARFAQELKNLVQNGVEPVSRKALHEVSDKIQSAVRASSNTMDVRHLQEIGTPKFCGPKRVRITRNRVPPRPCVPAPAPTPPNGLGICKLCVVYTYPITSEFADTACTTPVAASILVVLNSALLNGFPVLANQIGGQPPVCEVKKVGQQLSAVNGPYCRGPVDPADYPAIEEAAANAVGFVQSKTAQLKLATTQSTCDAPLTYASTTTVVGQDNQMLEITLVCDDGQPVAATTTFAAQCGGSS